MHASDLLWFLFLVTAVAPMVQRRLLDLQRVRFLRSWERRRGSRVIALIHRQETMSLLGFPLIRYIDIQDSEELLRALRLTAEDVPIDIVLHTPGGLALAADEIVMDPNAVLGSLDPQLGNHPAASIVRAVAWKTEHEQKIDDETLILEDIARKAMFQLRECVAAVLSDRFGPEKAAALADTFTQGQWTHDHPLNVETLTQLGLPINTDMPREIYDYMRLFPQASTGRPSVQYIPVPYRRPVPVPSPQSKRAGG